MKTAGIVCICLALGSSLFGQYAPAAGVEGSTAIHKDSLIIQGWATSAVLERGYIKISDTTLSYEGSNLPTLGVASDATGKADGVVVSLGDGGTAVLEFDEPIGNGEGSDFAVFENGFPAGEPPNQYFLELGFVEVSSDGEHYVRFPAVSNTPVSAQIDAFGQLDPTNIHNLAGKYTVFYGTPFDLDDVQNSTGLDPEHITHIRIRDVVGSVYPDYASYDSQGNPINDPWPTPFNSCGFDLDAVGVIHYRSNLSTNALNLNTSLRCYPNPGSAGGMLYLRNEEGPQTEGNIYLRISDTYGRLILEEHLAFAEEMKLKLPERLPSGIYFIQLRQAETISCIKLELRANN